MYLLYSARKTYHGDYRGFIEAWEKGQKISTLSCEHTHATRNAAIFDASVFAGEEAKRNVFQPYVCARTSINGKHARRRAMRKRNVPM